MVLAVMTFCLMLSRKVEDLLLGSWGMQLVVLGEVHSRVACGWLTCMCNLSILLGMAAGRR
jgi:hypothetical protein